MRANCERKNHINTYRCVCGGWGGTIVLHRCPDARQTASQQTVPRQLWTEFGIWWPRWLPRWRLPRGTPNACRPKVRWILQRIGPFWCSVLDSRGSLRVWDSWHRCLGLRALRCCNVCGLSVTTGQFRLCFLGGGQLQVVHRERRQQKQGLVYPESTGNKTECSRGARCIFPDDWSPCLEVLNRDSLVLSLWGWRHALNRSHMVMVSVNLKVDVAGA